jgi:hypothetical protein
MFFLGGGEVHVYISIVDGLKMFLGVELILCLPNDKSGWFRWMDVLNYLYMTKKILGKI